MVTTWSRPSPTRLVVYATLGVAGLAALRITWRVVRLFSHREEVLPWLSTLVPPMDYDYRQDVDPPEDMEQHFPLLKDLAENGTLCVVRRPSDFDRALPTELFVLGTAHVSRRTAEAVYRTIVEVEPDACIVELCKSRSFMLYREVPPSVYEITQDGSVPATTAGASTHTPPTTTAATTPAGEADKQQEEQLQQQQQQDAEAGASRPPPGQASQQQRCAGQPTAPRVAALGKPAAGAQQQALEPAGQRKAQGGPRPSQDPSLTSQLSSLVQALKTNSSPLQALLSWAYAKVEMQLNTVAGLEFIRAWHAIQEVERRRKVRALAALQQQQQQQHEQRAQGDSGGADGSGAAAGGGSSAGGAPAGARYASVQVYLGDVPLQRTISRIWGVLNVRQKLKLCWTLVRDCLTLQADDSMLEQLLEEDMLELMQKELGTDFPEILGPLLHERNWQLAHTVHNAAQHGMRRVVLVIGRGHVPGVIYCLMQPYRSRKFMRLPSADLAQLPTPAAGAVADTATTAQLLPAPAI